MMSAVSDLPLYAHTKRRQWGLAILAWESREARCYQFQDGQQRKIRRGYYELMQPVDRLDDSSARVVSSLKAMLRTEPKRRSVRAPAPDKTFSIDQQVEQWHALWPKGFRDAGYIEKVRGEGGKGRRKRDRDPAIERARDLLGREAMEQVAASGDFKSARGALVGVLKTTDLVQAKEAEALGRRRPPVENQERFARAIRDVLHGEAFVSALAEWIETLAAVNGGTASWPLVTAPLALVHPDEHICVRPTVLRAQARLMGIAFPTTASAEGYVQMQAMVHGIRRHLLDAGLGPRDLMDVYEFMAATAK